MQPPFRRIAISSGKWAKFVDQSPLATPDPQAHHQLVHLLADDIIRAYLKGADAIMIREGKLSPSSAISLLQAASETTRTLGISLIINDLNIFRLCQASWAAAQPDPYSQLLDGIHQKDDGTFGPIPRSSDLFIGRSCHTIQDLILAETAGYDYAFLSPIFPTATHPKAMPLGISTLEIACQQTKLPIFALGGITEQTEQLCIDAGAYGIAAIGMFGL